MLRVFTRRALSAPAPTALKRFWKEVAVKELPVTTTQPRPFYTVTLDGRSLKTPQGDMMSTENKTLAWLVASEWHAHEGPLKPNSLPITSLLARAIGFEKRPEERKDSMEFLQRYLHTDSICYHAEYPDRLVVLQNEHWVPIINWVKQSHGVKINTTTGMMGIRQSDETVAKLEQHIENNYSPIMLAGFEKATMLCKSYMIAMALVEGQITIEKAVDAARVETLAQTQVWGEVEDAHDVEIQDITRQLAGTVSFRFGP